MPIVEKNPFNTAAIGIWRQGETQDAFVPSLVRTCPAVPADKGEPVWICRVFPFTTVGPVAFPIKTPPAPRLFTINWPADVFETLLQFWNSDYSYLNF